MELMGEPVGPPRSPVLPLGDGLAERLQGVLDKLITGIDLRPGRL